MVHTLISFDNYLTFTSFLYAIGKSVPKMDLVRKHLMIEGHIQKDCLVRILNEVTAIYSK